MTSMSSAPSRPAPTFRPPRALPPGLKTESGVALNTNDDAARSSDGDTAHPAKRRKVNRPSTTSSPLPIPSTPVVQPGAACGDRPATELSRGPWRFSASFLASIEGNAAVEDGSPPSLPSRPWQQPPSAKTKEDLKPAGRVRKNMPIPNTPDKVEAPSEACKFGKTALAGFFPWTGKHPEDVLSETNVRNGYFDRPPNPPEKETASAKNALCGVFKNRSALETLSVLFGMALERKCKDGALSSTASFRPPPRVTLTEAKRKAWLADLANNEVPLRRLSRTIPQGIRGQSLLDQCLSNSVPIARALWFIRCVGANEIRTLKRKGPGGSVTGGSEIKWLKEWTSFVAQFLQTILEKFTEPDWKQHIQYAMKLTSQLYLENLVDRDAFLDWILKAFAAADHNQTPFFLLLVQMYLPDMIRFRRRSKKLSTSLVEKLDLARKANEEVFLPLISRLKDILCTFVTSRPVCFIMPEQWPQCKEALEFCLDLNNPGQLKLYKYIELRNERTAASLSEQGRDATTPQQAIIKLLDQSKAPFQARKIVIRCNALCPDDSLLLSTVLRWATSRYKASSHRLYLAVRLLRICFNEGKDVESALLACVTESSNHATDYASLHHLVAELSRTRTFSITKYLQSMIVRGSARPGSFVDSTFTLKYTSASRRSEIVLQTCNDPSQILSDISLKHLPDHVRNLRKLVLSRAGFRADTEADVVHHCQWFLSKKFSLANQSSLHPNVDEDYSVPPWRSLSWSVKCETSSWLRDFVKAQCKVYKDPMQPLRANDQFTTEDFSFVREILEKMEDFAVLADVLDAACRVLQEGLLASVVDTIDRHADVLGAIGAFSNLQEKVCRAYLALRPSKLPLTTLATSLLGLNERHYTKIISTKLLQQDMVQGDRGSAAAACSPFSDGVAESLQQAGSHFFDDFEAILQTETSMNEQTMSKLFAVLIERIEKQNLDGEHLRDLRAFCRLLARLRLCRLTQSTKLVKAWVERQMRRGEWRTTTALLVDLVGTGCLTFRTIVECVREVTKDEKKQPPSLSALTISLFTRHGNEIDAVHYRFETERMLYVEHNPIEALNVLATMDPAETLSETIQSIVKSSMRAPALFEVPLVKDLPDILTDALHHEADKLLKGNTPGQSDRLDGKAVVALADDFSYQICQLYMHLQMRDMEISSAQELGEAFFSTASNTWAPDSVTQQWALLLPAAGPEVARYVRGRAEEAFFASLPGFLQGRSIMPASDVSVNMLDMATKYLDIAFAAGDALTDQCTPPMTAQLIEKLSLIHRMLVSANTSVVSPMATTTPIPGIVSTPAAPTPSLFSPDTIATVSQYLPLLLRMICLQRLSSSISSVPLTKLAQQEQIKLTVLLTTVALHPALNTTALPSYILVVIATLITQPQFTDEMHAYCARLLKDKIRDPRVMFLFGNVNICGSSIGTDVGEGLQLHKEAGGRVGEWKQWVRDWEVIEPSGGGEGSSWVGLGMFGARRV